MRDLVQRGCGWQGPGGGVRASSRSAPYPIPLARASASPLRRFLAKPRDTGISSCALLPNAADSGTAIRVREDRHAPALRRAGRARVMWLHVSALRARHESRMPALSRNGHLRLPRAVLIRRHGDLHTMPRGRSVPVLGLLRARLEHVSNMRGRRLLPGQAVLPLLRTGKRQLLQLQRHGAEPVHDVLRQGAEALLHLRRHVLRRLRPMGRRGVEVAP